MMGISLKGIVFDAEGRVLLGYNPRQEWELPGGRPDPGDDSPQATVKREVAEECGIEIQVGELVDVWYYSVPGEKRVAVVSYLCSSVSGSLSVSVEHTDMRFHPLSDLAHIALPGGYATSIRRAAETVGVSWM
ncbi:MAG: NUDIX domain-containing protein [Actinomycetales bacterium]